VKAVCRGVKADVEGRLSRIHEFSDFFFVGHLRDKTARDEFFIYLHIFSSFLKSHFFPYYNSTAEAKSQAIWLFFAPLSAFYRIKAIL
jgi:hypothetical protein